MVINRLLVAIRTLQPRAQREWGTYCWKLDENRLMFCSDTELSWTVSHGYMEKNLSRLQSESHSVASDSLRPHGLHGPWNSPGQNTGVGSLSLLQGIFPTQGLNLGLLHCGWILPRILEWVACPFSSRSSQSRNRTRVSCIGGDFFTNWAIREATLLT